LLIIVLLLLFVPSIWAADFQVISTSELKSKLDAKEKFLLVNSLSDIEFNLEHIPGSVNIPVGEIQTTDKLPQDKETLIVFY
jgi:rhodanese-related sulfurtransferase